jgi:type I restriction enzyme S subunit
MAGEWQEVTVGDIAAPTRNALVGGPFGSNLVSRDYVERGIPVIRGQNMGDRWVGDEFVYVTEAKAESLEANLARPGDIIFTQRGTLGQVSLVPSEPYNLYLVSQSQMKLTIDRETSDPLFYYYFFRSKEQQEYIRQHAIQTGVPHTNLGILRNTPVPLPPIDEQRAIAHILGTLDDKIELNRKMNQTLETMARAIFKSWFVNFDPVRAKAEGRDPGLPPDLAALFPDSFEDSELGEIPKGWRVMPVGDALKAVGGSTPSTADPAFWNVGEYYWATPKDLSGMSAPILIATERKITNAGVEQISSGLLPIGTVLMSSRAPVGYLALSAIPVAVNQGFIAMICDGPVSNYYALNWCHNNMEEIRQRASGTTFAEISKTTFRPIPVIVPEDTIMKRYTQIVEPLYRSIEERVKESRTLAALRDTLLPKLLSREVRLQNAERFVELSNGSK